MQTLDQFGIGPRYLVVKELRVASRATICGGRNVSFPIFPFCAAIPTGPQLLLNVQCAAAPRTLVRLPICLLLAE